MEADAPAHARIRSLLSLSRRKLGAVESYDLDQHEEDLTLLLHAWPDIEEAMLRVGREAEGKSYASKREVGLPEAVRRAFRIEVQSHDPGERFREDPSRLQPATGRLLTPHHHAA